MVVDDPRFNLAKIRGKSLVGKSPAEVARAAGLVPRSLTLREISECVKKNANCRPNEILSNHKENAMTSGRVSVPFVERKRRPE